MKAINKGGDSWMKVIIIIIIRRRRIRIIPKHKSTSLSSDALPQCPHTQFIVVIVGICFMVSKRQTMHPPFTCPVPRKGIDFVYLFQFLLLFVLFPWLSSVGRLLAALSGGNVWLFMYVPLPTNTTTTANRPTGRIQVSLTVAPNEVFRNERMKE